MAQLDPGLTSARDELLNAAGAYLRNVRFIQNVTCSVCAGVTKDGWQNCYPCHSRRNKTGAANRLGFVIYAATGKHAGPLQQAGRVMHAYKDGPGGTSRRVVQILLTYAVVAHWTCISKPFGQPDAWTIVPSLKRRPGQHPLEVLASGFLKSVPQVKIAPASRIVNPREITPTNFVVPHNDARHVLLLDDAWVSGGHLQSSSIALQQSGVKHVTALSVARWLTPDYAETNHLISSLPTPFDPDLCPFTGQPC